MGSRKDLANSAGVVFWEEYRLTGDERGAQGCGESKFLCEEEPVAEGWHGWGNTPGGVIWGVIGDVAETRAEDEKGLTEGTSSHLAELWRGGQGQIGTEN